MSEIICVYRTDPHFKETAKRLNLSENALDDIVHEYTNELQDPKAFPSDSYIKARYAVDNTVSSKEVKDLNEIWEANFSTPVTVHSLMEAILLKNNAERYFKSQAVAIKPLNDGTFQVIVARPRVANIASEQAKGPIVYNAEQLAAIDAAVKHIDDVRAGKQKQKFFTIQGKAGTGKTTIVNEILNRMKRGIYSRPIVIMGANTHKATTVLKGKINADTAKNFEVQNKTIAGMLGMKPVGNEYAPIPGQIPPIQRASVVFIDEASMVSEQHLELILNALKGKSIPVIFLGDVGQLPPVRKGRYFKGKKIASDKISPVFEDSTIPSAKLTTRVRQGEDSPVLDYADGYWDYSQGKRKEYPNDLKAKSKVTDKGALIIQREEVDLVQQLLPLFQEAKRTGNPNLVKIVAYTRNSDDHKESAVDRYNRLIREKLYPNSKTSTFEKGDLIILNETYVNETSSIPNSFESAVERVRPCESALPHFDGVELEEVERVYITFDTPYGHAEVPALVPTLANKLKHQRNLNKIAKYCESNRRSWPRFYDYKQMYAADISYAYAIGDHKSQGSTYEVVAVDVADINGVQPTTLTTKAQGVYTALTRASNVTIVSSNTTNESTVYTDIKAINDRINAVKAGQEVNEEFTPEIEEDVFAEVTEDDLPDLIKDPERKLKRVKKKGNVADEDYNPVIENADIPDYDKDEGEDFDEDDEEDDDNEEDEEGEKSQSESKKKSETPQEKTYREFVAAQKQLNSIIKFKKATHTYIVNGVKADFSVTEFKDFILGVTKNTNDFLAISSRLGNTHDAFLRDYFANDLQDSYPNLTSEQIEKLKIQASKLETLLTKTFGEDAIFITDEDLLRTAATVTYDGKEYTVAGTMDMVVIDSKGDIYIVDFKTKRANVSEELNKDQITGYGLQVSLYKAFVSSNPLFKNKTKKSYIAQFNVKYADPRRYDYSFKGEQIYIELDDKVSQLQEAQRDGKVPYKPGVFTNKLLGLSIDLEDEDIEVSQIKTGPQKLSEQRKVNKETSVEPQHFEGKMLLSYGKQKRDDVKAATTFGAILEGKRTATTRTAYWDYWKKVKVGDIITFKDGNGKTVDVRVTVAPHKLSKDLDLDEWSEKEGWTKDRFTKHKDDSGKTLMDYTKEGKAFQMEYELLNKKVPSSIEVDSYNKKYALLSNFGDKEFEIDDKTFPTVEHYFHWVKAIHCKDFTMANRIKKAVSAKQARYLGKHVLKMTKAQQASWDKMSRNVMKKGMKAAFEQNEDAKDLLLSTGTALLTHKLGGPFADILMELREEFGGAGKPSTIKEAEKKAREDAKKSKEVPEAPRKKSTSSSQFIESTGGYQQRTKENADWSDITLDLTESDKGSGGRNELTKRVAGNKYIHFKLTDEGDNTYDADEILAAIEEAGLPTENIKLNIAGSEIGKLNNDQEVYNEEVTRLLKGLQDLGVIISEIRSGGQTGIDEAGIIAAQRLGIKWSVNAPKGWKFRDSEGEDHEDEEAFKARFGSQTSEWTRRGEKQFKISTEGYRKEDPKDNPDIAYVFTENAQAASNLYEGAQGYASEVEARNPKLKLAVSDVKGTNQAGIRMGSDGKAYPNTYGIVVKKRQQDENGNWLSKEGQFEDTDEDFEIFKEFNNFFFDRLDEAPQKKIIFPSQMAYKGKAALPKRFAEWLAEELKTRYGIISTVRKNKNDNYEGYGLSIDSVQEHKENVSRTHTKLINDLGGDDRAKEEVQDAVKVAKKGLSLEEALDEQESIFTKSEIAQIRKALNGKNLQVMSVSRLTDPAFFADEIVKFLKENSKKPFTDPTRVNAIEIWSKHDGLPIKTILKACKEYKVAPMVSFSITSLGDTALEKGVMKYKDMLQRVGELVKDGTLNPVTTTIRIDPILVGVTGMDKIRDIVQTAKSFGIKKFVTSLMQSYGYTENQVAYYDSETHKKRFYYLDSPKDVEALKEIFPIISGVKTEDNPEEGKSLVLVDAEGNPLTELSGLYYNDRKVVAGINRALETEQSSYDWEKYYGIDKRGKIEFKPKQEYIDEIAEVLLELNEDPEISIQTCAFNIKGLKVSACLDPMIIERVTGVDVTRRDGSYDRDTSRPQCMCYGCHGDLFKGQRKKCYSSCAYCYAAHSFDSNIEYYNEDGTLKDSVFTRTDEGLHVEKISGRYTPKTSSDVEQFNTAAEALRKQGWHVEFYSKKSKDGSITNDVMTISIEGNPKKGFFELVKDQEEGNYSVHFKTKSKKAMNDSEFAEEALEDSEKEDMFKALIYAIPEGGTVSTWGTLSKGGISALDSLAKRSGGALQKIGDKLAKDSEGNDTRIPVYKKLTEDELAEANIAKVRKITAVRKNSAASTFSDDFYGLNESTAKDDRFTSMVTITLGDPIKSVADGSKDNVLRSLITSLPYSALISLDTSRVDPNFLYTLNELLHNPTLHEVPVEEVISIDPNSEEGWIAKDLVKKGKRIQYNSETGELRVPKFTTGYSITEIEKRAAYDRMINNDLLTQEELRSLSKAAMYKLSEFITIIQSYANGYETLFGQKSDKDFTKMSRIDIINEVGLKNLLLKVRERVFDSENAAPTVSLETLDKMDIVFNNWDAFVELGYDTLIGLEEIALDSKQNVREDIKNDLNDVVEEDDESIIQELFGSSLEHWQVGFRQVSAFSSLSKLIKRTMDSLYELDQDGNQVVDEFGIAKHLDAQTAVSKILHFTQGAQSLDDKDASGELRINSMLYMLKKNANAEPWIEQVIKLIEGEFDEQGNLVKPADEQFRAQFYSNFKKYFQKYAITFKKTVKGKAGEPNRETVLIKIINESEYSDNLLKECQAKENSFATGGFKLKTKEGDINEGNLKKLKKLADKIEKFNDAQMSGKKIKDVVDLDDYHKTLKEVFDLLDIDTPADESLFNLFGVKKNLKDFSKHLSYLVDALKDGVTVTNNRDYQQIVKLVAKEMGLEMESVSYESGKMYYSYVLPSYLGRLTTKLKAENMSDEEYKDFLQNEYFKYKWFRTDKGKVRCHWLDRLRRSKEARENFEHVTSLHYLGTDYSSKTPMEYIASMMRMYFFDNNKKWAFFRVPMLSNKPSEEYIKFERITTAYRDTITDYMWDVFTQELDRIQAVRERRENTNKDQRIVSKGKKTAFDSLKDGEESRGSQFVFEDYLQKYLDGTYSQRPEYKNLTKKEQQREAEFSRILNAKLDGTLEEDSEDSGKLITLFKEMTKRGFEENYQLARQQWVDEGFLTLNQDGTIKKVAGNMKLSEEDLREFFWNDAFAATQILELTITDMAYYVDTEDLQKRLAQLHAPGMQAHIHAKDKHGNYYTKDGIERTMYIKDDMVKSHVLRNLEKAKEQILASTPNDRKATVGRQLAGIINAFSSINFADAQGYSCPSSYRKKMGIFGNWDDRMEDAYEKVTHPEKYPDVNLSDMLDVLWQPLKPFVYSQIAKPGYNSILPELKVSVQNKNSEYVLVIADALLQRAGIPNKLRAIYEFMEESQHNSNGELNGEGIDTVQFMSAVNAGCSGVIDLNDTVNSNGSITYVTEDEVKKRLSKAYTIDDDGTIVYSRDYVHEIPFEDYIIQQNVPAHFMNHEQVHGSQDRILTFADILDEDPVTGEVNYLTIDGKQVSVAEAKKNYFKAIADNIEESMQELVRRFKLDNTDPRARNIAISRVLKDTILKDSRYGSDLLWACDTNEYGEFNIPLSDPTQSTRIQQLLNSIIKNTINKQEIAGGPIVQVSNWGTSTQLAIRFKTKANELLLTEGEFNELKKPFADRQLIPKDYDYVDSKGHRKWKSVEEYNSYAEYIDDQAGVAYYEALVPIPNEDFAKDFTKTDADGNEYIDVEEIERTNPDLLYMIGYRIPTESKYSMVPIKIKGFLPRVGGEGIMLPAEITSQAGSDFDIDKEYIMRFVFNRIEKAGKVTYEKPKEGKGYRNNLIIATQLAVLQSEQVQKQLFTPGNFDEPKKYGYLISYVQNEATRTGRDPEDIWDEAMEVGSKMSVDDFNDWLKKKNKTSKNLIFNNVQVQFHKQNMTAGKLIGIFAQANVSHAFISLEKDAMLQIPEEDSFTINGIHVGGSFSIDDIPSIDKSTNISNNLAALLAASVDAVKDPILNLINININTANMVTSMLRMGFSLETVSLLVSQPVIKDLIRDYAIQKAEKYVDLNDLIYAAIDAIPDDIKQVADISVTSEDLIANLNGDSAITNYMVLKIFQRMQDISDVFGDITHMTRYNSVAAAVGPFASDTMLQKTKDDAFYKNCRTGMIGAAVKEACDNPILHAFREYSYYVESKILGEHLIQAGKKFETALDTLGRTLGFRRGVPAKTANAFSDFFMSFYVNDSERGSVFDLGYENRKYMLTQFPKDFLRLKKKHKDNMLMNSIQYVESDREQYPFLRLKTRGLNSTVLEDIKNAWITLYNNPDSRDLAIRLAEYNYFRGSFGFSPKTFMNLVPNVVKSGLNGYIDVLNSKDSRVETGDRIERIIHQFILHNPKLIIDRYYKLENYSPVSVTHDVYGECITVKVESSKESTKRDYTLKATRPFIKIDSKTYYVVDSDRDTMTLKEVDELGGDGQGFELSVDEEFPKSIFDSNFKATKKESNDEGNEPFKRDSISQEAVGVIIDQLFDEDEIQELNDLKIPKAIDRINKRLEDSGNDYRLSHTGKVEKMLMKVLDSVEGIDNPSSVLNGSGKTVKDLKLCS